jgi:hypothetical protein
MAMPFFKYMLDKWLRVREATNLELLAQKGIKASSESPHFLSDMKIGILFNMPSVACIVRCLRKVVLPAPGPPKNKEALALVRLSD